MSDRLEYRHEVDGLRALAVLSVALFHLDFDFARAGFVGVDIFYVISGFVIFRGVLDAPRYDFAFVQGFYARRWRRIMPALIATVMFSMALGFLVLTPDEYASLAKSALATTFFVSNIYFNDTLSYFANSVRTMPLLHTWSLGVEEQFYIFAPWLLFAFGRPKQTKRILVAVIVITGLSFAYNLFASYFMFDERHAFYLPMSRFWEIGCGALAALSERRWRPSAALSKAMAMSGLAGFICSGLFIDSTMSFPGFPAVLPVVSATLLILAEPRPGTLVFGVLASPPARFIGRISYSTYLLHWPVIIYLGLLIGRDLSHAERWATLGLILALAAASWRFIEEPFRHARPGAARTLWLTGAGVLATVCASLLIVSLNGLPGRLNDAALRASAWKERQIDPEARPCDARPTGFPSVRRATICSLGDAQKPNDYLLWGDSHAGMYGVHLGRRLREDGYNGALATLPDCPPLVGVHTSKRKNRAECAELGRVILDRIRAKDVRLVILSSRWANMGAPVRAPGDGAPPRRLFRDSDGTEIPIAEAMKNTVEALTQAGAKVLVIGPSPEMHFDVPDALTRALQLGLTAAPMPRQTFDERQADVLQALAPLSQLPNVSVVYPHETLCTESACRFERDNEPFYVDDDHLSPEGVNEVLPAIEAAFQKLWRN